MIRRILDAAAETCVLLALFLLLFLGWIFGLDLED